MFQSNADMRGTIDRLLDRITGSLWVIVTLTFGAASLGVVNTLTMNVIEQARDLRLMRAVGMTDSQTRRLVLSQAFLLGAVSIVFGAAAGIGFAALINRASNVVFGQQVAFSVDFVLTGGCVVVGIAITTLAAILPANRAVRYSGMARGEKG
jgi:putative ABC transport system permease protein